jgi:ubiquinone biosynthesis protein UbiJ
MEKAMQALCSLTHEFNKFTAEQKQTYGHLDTLEARLKKLETHYI